MKHLQRIPLLAVVFAASLALVPAVVPGLLAHDGPDAAVTFAPYHPERAKSPATGTETAVVLKNWEFTQTTSSPSGTSGGGRVRR